MTTTPELPPHLGGSAGDMHMDIGAFEYLKSKFSIESMVDLGCGLGGMVDYANEKGVGAIGIDGDWTLPPKDTVRLHDFTKGPFLFPIQPTFDLAWSTEFVEHVEPRYVANYAAMFQRCKYICFTHAVPGQGGHHHVNCQPKDYWVFVMHHFNIMIDEEATAGVRKASTMKNNFMRDTGLVFVNRTMVAEPPQVLTFTSGA